MERLMKDSGIPYIGSIPGNWKIVRNKNAFSLGKEIVGDAWERTQLLSLTTKGIKCIKIGDTSGKVPDSYATYQKVVPGNLVMCLFDLDVSAVFSGLSDIAGMISPAYKVLSIHEDYYAPFCQYWFSYIFDGRKFKFMAKNIRYSLTYDEFAALAIVAPTYSEQLKIAAFLDRKCGEVDELIALEEKMIEELKAYKQSVITETITKGLNPDAPMKDSGIEWIGQIPEHWEACKLGYIFIHNTGKALKESDTEGDLLQYITTSNLYWGYFILNEMRSMYFKPSELDKCTAYNGDLLVCEGGDVGRAAIWEGEPICIQNHIHKLRSKKNVSMRYYYYVMFAAKTNGVFETNANGIAIQGLSSNALHNTIIPEPPLEEQTMIAKSLDFKCKEIDSLISIKQSKIAELQDYKKSIIYEYATGKKEVPSL